MDTILGISIATLALLALIVGILSLFKGALGNIGKIFTGWVPGGPKMGAIVFIAAGLIFGAYGAGAALLSNATGNLHIASIGSDNSDAMTAPPLTAPSLTCTLSTIGATTGATTANLSYVADTSNLQHYTIYGKENAGASVVNGTLSCIRSGSISDPSINTCYVVGDTFRNGVSPATDTNSYNIIATTGAKSKISGVTWAQTAYINDGALATSSSDSELSQIVMNGGSSAQAKETVGFQFALPGATLWGYQLNQTSNNVHIKCDGNDVYSFTVTKVAGN